MDRNPPQIPHPRPRSLRPQQAVRRSCVGSVEMGEAAEEVPPELVMVREERRPDRQLHLLVVQPADPAVY